MFLGLDLSLTGTGIALIDDAGSPVFLKTFNGKSLRGAERLVKIRETVGEIAPLATHVALEGYAYGATGKAFEIGELGGVIKVLLHENSLTPLIVTPQAVKKWATGIGRGGKVGVGVSLYREFSMSFSDDNSADAFVLAWICKHFYSSIPEKMLTKPRVEVIKNLQC